MLDDFRPRDVFAGVAHEVFEQSELLGSEFQHPARAPGLVLHEIQFEIFDAQSGFGQARAAAKQRADARAQLGKSEGLEHDVVGAEVEHLGAIFRARAQGENENRQMRMNAAQLTNDVENGGITNPDVQQRSSEFHARGDAHGLFAARGKVDIVVVRFETSLEKRTKSRVVLDEQNTHGWAPTEGETTRGLANVRKSAEGVKGNFHEAIKFFEERL
jgi:hypothetical protein